LSCSVRRSHVLDEGPPMPTLPRSCRVLLVLVLALGATATGAWAQDSKAEQAKAKRVRRDRPGTYMGRPIAPVMSYMGAEWLIRESRVEEEQPERMLDALKLKAGDVVADVGAGVGYTSEKIARRVGPTGKVLATDVQPEMIAMLKDRMRAAG